MSLNREEGQKEFRPSEVDLDTLLTNFLDKEIGVSSDKNELAPDLDLKLTETLREIGMVNTPPLPPPVGTHQSSPLSTKDIAAPVPLKRENSLLDDPDVEAALVPPPGSESQVISVATLADSAADLDQTARTIMEIPKPSAPNRTMAFSLGALGILLGLAVVSYLWMGSKSNEKKPVSASGVESTASTPGTAGSTPSILPEAENTQQASSASSLRKPDLPQFSNNSPNGPVAGGKTLEATPQKAGSSATGNVADLKSTAESGRPMNRVAETKSPALPSPSPAPPPAPYSLVPELPSPEGAGSVAIRDLSLPRLALQSTSQPQIALPTAAPTQPTSTGVATPAVALTKIRVIYPEMARRARAEGTVEVEFSVDVNGKVVQVSAKTGPLTLRKAAEDAVYKTRFKPATSNGMNIPAKGRIALVFKLDKP